MSTLYIAFVFLIPRQAHSIVNALAKRARFSSLFSVWMESISPDISSLVIANLPVFWLIRLLKCFSKKNK